ncbi:MAG: NAD-dependent epimerase/dehydratase family protein [Casimicrobium sp.]
MNLSIFGGTGYIGTHQLRYALARGHRVTLLSRGHRRAEFCHATASQLSEHESQARSDWPVWISDEGETTGAHRRGNARRIAAVLTYRPLSIIVTDTLSCWKSLPESRRTKLKAGLTAERESSVLASLG